jgi:hypothetical protein
LRYELRFRAGKLEKPPRLLDNLAKVEETKAMPNDVQEIAMLAGCGIGPLARRTFRRVVEPHKHRAAAGVVDIPDQPIPPLTLAVGEIVSAHRLGFSPETMCQFGGVAEHHAASRSAMCSIA